MAIVTTQRWESLERWSPRLFLLGAVLELVFASVNGAAFLIESFSFVDWVYPAILLGRLAVLFGIAGLSVQVVNRNPRLGKLGRVVVAVTVAFTIGLLSLSILDIVGVSTPIIALFGLGTVVLTIVTYALFGAVIISTGAFSTPVGSLLLVASLTVLGVFVGLRVLPTELMGAVGEGVLFVLFLSTGYFLRAESEPSDRMKQAPEGAVK